MIEDSIEESISEIDSTETNEFQQLLSSSRGIEFLGEVYHAIKEGVDL